MQNHDLVGGGDFVDQVRGPKHAKVLFRDKLAHDRDNTFPRANIQADSRFVEQQATRTVQKRAGNLHAPSLAAGQVAHLLILAVGETNTLKSLFATLLCFRAWNAVKRRMIHQVLAQREVLIQRAALEDNTEPLQGRTSCPIMRISPLTLS